MTATQRGNRGRQPRPTAGRPSPGSTHRAQTRAGRRRHPHPGVDTTPRRTSARARSGRCCWSAGDASPRRGGSCWPNGSKSPNDALRVPLRGRCGRSASTKQRTFLNQRDNPTGAAITGLVYPKCGRCAPKPAADYVDALILGLGCQHAAKGKLLHALSVPRLTRVQVALRVELHHVRPDELADLTPCTTEVAQDLEVTPP